LGLIIKRSEFDGEQPNFLNMPLRNVRFKKLENNLGDPPDTKSLVIKNIMQMFFFYKVF
jgi:hypothetical protein